MWPIGPTTAHLDELDVDAGYCPAGCTTAQHEDVDICPAFVRMRILLHGDIARPWAIACSDESCETVFCTSHGQLSEPQVNLKNNDGPEPKPPASSFFLFLARPDFPTLVPVVVPGKIWDLRHIRAITRIYSPVGIPRAKHSRAHIPPWHEFWVVSIAWCTFAVASDQG